MANAGYRAVTLRLCVRVCVCVCVCVWGGGVSNEETVGGLIIISASAEQHVWRTSRHDCAYKTLYQTYS